MIHQVYQWSSRPTRLHFPKDCKLYYIQVSDCKDIYLAIVPRSEGKRDHNSNLSNLFRPQNTYTFLKHATNFSFNFHIMPFIHNFIFSASVNIHLSLTACAKLPPSPPHPADLHTSTDGSKRSKTSPILLYLFQMKQRTCYFIRQREENAN